MQRQNFMPSIFMKFNLMVFMPIILIVKHHSRSHKTEKMDRKSVLEVVVKKDPEQKHVDRRIKTLKYLLELGNNEEDRTEHMVGRKESHKFLYEALCFKEEFGDDHIVPELRAAIEKNEKYLAIAPKTTYKREPSIFLVDGLKPPPQFRDNDETECREMFDDEQKMWVPIFEYKTREKLACHYCKCAECKWETRNLHYHCLSAPRSAQPKRHTRTSEPCNKHKYYLPYVERDDDEGLGIEFTYNFEP